MRLDPSPQLTVVRMEAAFADEYLQKEIASLSWASRIALKLGNPAQERALADRAHKNILRDIEQGILTERYEKEILPDWSGQRQKFIGGLSLSQTDELKNIEALKKSFARAQELGEYIERPAYIVSPYDAMRRLLQK